jgi:hypothetical protein
LSRVEIADTNARELDGEAESIPRVEVDRVVVDVGALSLGLDLVWPARARVILRLGSVRVLSAALSSLRVSCGTCSGMGSSMYCGSGSGIGGDSGHIVGDGVSRRMRSS